VKSLLVTGAHHRAICALYEQQLEHYRAELLAAHARAEKSEQRVQELHAKILETVTLKEAAAAEPAVARRRDRITPRASSVA